MGQGIISRSNPGNTGDKVGDIRITTRDSLGSKWALCNGTICSEEIATIKKDPLNDSSWVDIDVDFSSEEFMDQVSITSEYKYLEILKGKYGHYLVYFNYSSNNFAIIKMNIDSSGTPIYTKIEGSFSSTECGRYEDDDTWMISTIINDEEGVFAVIYAMDISASTQIDYDEFNLDDGTNRNSTEFYVPSSCITYICKTKNRFFLYSNDLDINAYMITNDGTLENLIEPCTGTDYNCIVCDYESDTSYVNIVGFEDTYTMFISNEFGSFDNLDSTSVIGIFGKYLFLNDGSVMDAVSRDELLYVKMNMNVSNADTFSGAPTLSIFYDENKYLIVQASDYVADIDGNGSTVLENVIILENEEANFSNLYGKNFTVTFTDDSKTEVPQLVTGDYSNTDFYFRARGINEICMARLPEISVDDESYCFIKIKD